MRLIPFLAVLITMATLTTPTPVSQANEIQFVEEFVLAKDRARAIEQLIPGTDVYYFYQCIHLQNNQKYDDVNKLLTQWQQRHGESQALKEIRNRQMLLTYSTNPKRTLDYLIHELRPNLSHQRDQLESKPTLPTKLDQSHISYDTLKKAALRRHKGLRGFEDRALTELRPNDLDPLRRRELLTRLKRPTHPNLVDLIHADLTYKGSRGFGSLDIHRQLLLQQLDELISRRPAIENESQFVNVYLQKLQPNPNVDWQHDPEALESYLQRMWDYVRNLNASHNSLKAHVLYHWLVLDETRGTYNKKRFLTYLALPRPTHYVAPRLLEDAEARRYPVDLAMNPGNVTLFPPIRTDEPLVRRYFLHFFQAENNFTNYVPYVKDDYLRHLFAEAKVTNGLGDPEKWYALLPPAKYQELKDRVDLDFAPTNPNVFRSGDPVQLDLYVKNVDKLIVKVYEVNTPNYYRQYSREVNTDIELDGLVANHELTHRYDDPPEIRRRRHFEFPELQESGVYVIDFIGNGKSSRAVVRKGQLHYISKISAAGHVFQVFNDKLEKLNNVSLWMSGQQFESETDGSILVPFSTKPGRQPVVLTDGDFSSLHFFQHEGENYQFNVAAYIDREALLDRQEAVVLLRPELRLSGIPVSTTVLEDVQVTIQSTNIDGVNAEKTYKDVAFFENKDTPLVFHVPSRLASIQVTVTAIVTDARQDKRTVEASHQVTVNQIDGSDKIEDLHLTKIGGVYVLELLGKSGEPRAHRPVNLQLRHKQFTDIVRVNLATDENGLVQLGGLKGITYLAATGPATPEKSWPLRGDRRTATRSIHARQGQTVRLPHMKGPAGLSRKQVTLYELRGGSYAKDLSKSVKIADHFVELDKLSAGDYSLDIDGNQQLVRVVDGRVEAGYVLGNLRRVEQRRLPPVQLTSITTNDKQLKVQLENISAFTRVHIYATRFVPAFDVYQALSSVREIEPATMFAPAPRSFYMAGRKLGDELQYVLERAYATKYPGNLLERPTLLLNSWPMRGTETKTQTAAEGEEFDAAAAPPSSAAAAREKSLLQREAGLTDFANLDFLAEPAVLAANQHPDDMGVVLVDLEDLGAHQHIHVVAVDPLSTVYRSLALPKVTMAKRDLRLRKGLDAEKHFTQQKSITQLTKNEKFELADITTGRFETYDSLASVYALYSTLSGNDVLRQFRFILDWPKLSTDEKREKYSEFSCHELNFFLYKKDPEFFTEVVRPYIENKQNKTFLDLWLLDADLTDFLRPWRYKQLNVAERLLLGERIDGEYARARRFVEDQFGLIPRDVGRQNYLFETAVQGKSLDLSLHAALASGLISDQQLGAIAGNVERLQESRGYALDMDAGAVVEESLELKSESLSRGRKRTASSNRARAQSRSLELGDADEESAAGRFFDTLKDLPRRRQLYEKLEKTQEWAENNYYRLPIEAQDESLILVNAFWDDFAKRRMHEPFFSIHWPTATQNFSEMMFALSLLDLPLEATEHETKFDELRMTLTAAGPMVVFQEQIREAELKAEESPILITQNLFRADDRYQMVQGVRRDKFVTEEFLAHVVYGCQVVLTNPTSTQRKVQLLIQIPHASMATNGGKATKTVDFDLAPYHTETVDYFFYFPAAGEYQHFPAHVSQDETLLAHASPTTLKVVETPSHIDKQSWEYLSQFGTGDEVLTFLHQNNVFEVDLGRIAFRMQDRAFFDQTISLLKQRHCYSGTLWAYGLKHNDLETIATYLNHNDEFLAACGDALDSELIQIDPVVRRTYQHLDYKPLVNARAHRLGGRRQILNDRFFEQYHNLLDVLKYRRDLDNEDRIAMTYYLLLQDRIEEAITMFSTVERSNLESQIQYDYFAAYLDCFRDEPAQARAIVTRYVDHPVTKWQHAFASVKGILDELDGDDVLVVDPKDRTQTQTAAAAEQTNFTFTVEDREVRVDYQNVRQLQVNYYLIDLELLFSSSPFVQKFSGQFSHIRPHDTEQVTLPADGRKHAFELPAELHNRNILVEIVAGGITRSQAYFSNSLTVQVSENYGHLRVTETSSGKPLPKTYVKVYSEMNDGRTLFYKDGYTDLRGRFDYSSLSTNELDFVKRFSILVLDDARGGLVREAQAPKR